jgi:hypothetical protein
LPRNTSASIVAAAVAIAIVATATDAVAHAVAAGDKGYIMCGTGARVIPFLYLGAKHMVTGYDHLLFLVGVIFFLYRNRDIAVYVTLFALGHSATLMFGVLSKVAVDPHLIDAVIGMSVAYKALDNIGALKRWFAVQPNAQVATMIFGLFHGFGLASKMIEFELSRDGLVANLVAFNVGVEIGQLLALTAILMAMNYWRQSSSFMRNARSANLALVAAGIALVAYQLVGYLRGGA